METDLYGLRRRCKSFMAASSPPNSCSKLSGGCGPFGYSFEPYPDSSPAGWWSHYQQNALAILRECPNSEELYSVEFLYDQLKKGGEDTPHLVYGFGDTCRRDGIPICAYCAKTVDERRMQLKDFLNRIYDSAAEKVSTNF